MGFLNIFSLGELVALMMVVLQLILVTVMLRDKRLWRIRQNSEHPSAARGWLEGQSNVDRVWRSADMELPHSSSPRSSMSSRRHFPRFIRSSRDSQVLFEEHRKELEAQLAQWSRTPRGCGVTQAEVPTEPGLLGGKESSHGPAEERPKVDVASAPGEATAEAGAGGSSRALELDGSSRTAMAWFVPRDVLIAQGSEGSSSSSSSSPSLGQEFNIPSTDPWLGPAKPPAQQALPTGRPRGREAGRPLGKLRARLGGCLAAWWSRHLPPYFCRRR